MRNILIVLLLIAFSSCQKDGITYNDPPKLVLQVINTAPNTVLFIATTTSQDSVIRGFVISKTEIPVLTHEGTEIMWSPRGRGDFAWMPHLEANQQYWVSAFCYFEGGADKVSYSNVIVFKAW